VYRNNASRFFGPYHDPQRPLASRVDRINPFEEDVTMSTADFLASIERTSPEPPIVYVSTEIDRLDPALVDELEPLNEFLVGDAGVGVSWISHDWKALAS
jgi:hypothetical protein